MKRAGKMDRAKVGAVLGGKCLLKVAKDLKVWSKIYFPMGWRPSDNSA